MALRDPHSHDPDLDGLLLAERRDKPGRLWEETRVRSRSAADPSSVDHILGFYSGHVRGQLPIAEEPESVSGPLVDSFGDYQLRHDCWRAHSGIHQGVYELQFAACEGNHKCFATRRRFA